MHRIKPAVLERARELRRPMTRTETLLWARVRNNQIGHKLRRQHPIDRFIADFYCAESRLVIEIDGDVHADPERMESDAARTEWLQMHGYAVIRFSNDDVLHRLDGVLQAIVAACEQRA